MNLLGFASFAWGLWHGYKHSALIVVLAVSAALVIGDILLNWKALSKGIITGHDLVNLSGGLVLYFLFAFISSLMFQGFGYFIGRFI
jgi:hypothetical protein